MLKEINKKIIVGLAILGLIFPLISFAARTDSLWDYPNGSTYLKPIGSPAGNDILLFGSNHYLNWGAVSGTNGYGIRDNAGSMEFKNSGGSWAGLGSGGGGTLTTLTAGTGITFSSGATCTITCTINATGGTNFFTNFLASTSLTTGSLLEAGNFNATSTTAINTFSGNVAIGSTGAINNINFLGTQANLQIQGASYLSLNGVLGKLLFLNGISTTVQDVLISRPTLSSSSIFQTAFTSSSTITQTGTAGYCNLCSFVQETSLGSGTHNLIQAGTSATTSLFAVDNQGTTTVAGRLGVGTTTPNTNLAIDLGVVSTNLTDFGQSLYADAQANQGYVGQALTLKNSTAMATAYSRLARTAATAYLGYEIGSASRDGIRFLTATTNGTPAEAMRIDATGNVGIGTTSPLDTLDIKSASGNQLGFVNANPNIVTRAGDVNTTTSFECPEVSTTSCVYRMFRSTLTSGSAVLQLYKGDGTTNVQTQIPGGTGNTLLNQLGGQTNVGNSGLVLTSISQLFNTLSASEFAVVAGNSSSLRELFAGVRNDSATSTGIYVRDDNSNTTQRYMDFYTNKSVQGRWDQNGNLGIGTTTPPKRLSVQVSSLGDGIDLDSNGTPIGAITTLSTGGIVGMDISGSNNGAARPLSLGGAVNTNILMGLAGGNIGIGTTSPYAKLSVLGQVVGSYFTATTSTASTFPYASTTALSISSLGTPAGSFLAVDPTGLVIATTTPAGSGTNYFTLTGNLIQNNVGNALGINVTPNSAALEVQGTTSNSTANGLAVWNSSGSNVLIARNDGNVGIGSTTPDAHLSILSTSNNNTSLLNIASSTAGLATTSAIYVTDNGEVDIGNNLKAANTQMSIGTSGGMTITPGGIISKLGGIAGTGLGSSNLSFLASGSATIANTSGTAGSLLSITGGSSATSQLNLQSTAAVGTFDSINLKVGNNGSITALTATSSGNVGIGTTSPYTNFSVNGSSYLGTTATAQSFIGLSTSVASIFPYASTTAITSGCFQYIGQPCLPQNATSTNFWYANGTTIYNSNSGNVGIGTTSPYATLSVTGFSDLGNSARAGFFTATSSTHSTFAGQIDAIAGVSGGFYQGSSGAFTSFPNTAALTSSAATFNGGNGAGFTPRASMINDGRFGIGSTSPQSMLSIVNNLQVATGTPSIWVASTTSAAPATHFVLDSVGHQWTGGATPVCSTNCATVAGDDNTMVVTASSGIGGNLVVNFSSPWKSPTTGLLRSPSCMVNEAGGATLLVAASTTPTSLTLTATSIGTNPLYIICAGSVNFTQ